MIIMRRHPDWLKVKIGSGEKFAEMKKLLRSAKLHTICEEAKCPNIAECFGCGTAVFLILGDICTRNCKYCNVKHGQPSELIIDEPKLVAESVDLLGLKYVVVTSVTRDDLPDGGANVFYETVKQIRSKTSDCKIEVLIPDFKGDITSIKRIVESEPDVINHNIEVVSQLFSDIRPEGCYKTSLNTLKNIKKIKPEIKTKSGFMVGLGETKSQIIQTMNDLKNSGVNFITIGQYLQPSREHIEIKKYYTPDEFEELREIGIKLGFDHVESGPLVRSSYHAEKAIRN